VFNNQNVHNKRRAILMPGDRRSKMKGISLKLLRSYLKGPPEYSCPGNHILVNSLSDFMQPVRNQPTL
jgi:hypothetical protein